MIINSSFIHAKNSGYPLKFWCFINNIFFVSIAFLLLLSGCGGSSGNIPATALLQSISVTPSNQSTPTGGALQFTATATYGGGTTVDITSSAIWGSSSTTIATVNSGSGSV
jgi:hypothetical protein